MHALRLMCRISRKGRIRNANIKENIMAAPVAKKSMMPNTAGTCNRYDGDTDLTHNILNNR